MPRLTKATRKAALEVVEAAGYTVTRIGAGQRYVYRLERGGQTWRALLKIASASNLIGKVDVPDADLGKLSGFGPDVDHVLIGVRIRGTDEVSVFLVPIGEVDAAFRDGFRAWAAEHPETAHRNRSWVLHFHRTGHPDCGFFHEKWARYRIEPAAPDAQIEAARELLAARHGVAPERVRFLIDV